MVKKPFRIAVLASGNGTDLQAILDEIKARKMPGVRLEVVISDVEASYALERARGAGLEAIFLDPKGRSREEYGAALVEILEAHQVELVCLVGFMRILASNVVRHFKHRIINVHPALLPKYGGKGFHGDAVHEAVLASGDPTTGMTLHFVDEGCDTGPILHQVEVPVEPGDTVHTLKGKVQALEKKWYPEIIRWIQHGKIVMGEE